MSRALTPPSAGQPISASFFAELLREVRANRLVNGPGYRTKRTPNGTFLDIDQAKPAKTKPLPSCFEYAGTTDEGGNKFYGRPYYMLGSRLYRAKEEDCGCSESPGIDYLKIDLTGGEPEATVAHAATYADLQQVAEDKDVAIIPLYEFDQNGKVAADLRTMPLISAWEFNA